MHKLNVIARRTVWIHIIILHRVRWYNFRYSRFYEGGPVQCGLGLMPQVSQHRTPTNAQVHWNLECINNFVEVMD